MTAFKELKIPISRIILTTKMLIISCLTHVCAVSETLSDQTAAYAGALRASSLSHSYMGLCTSFDG